MHLASPPDDRFRVPGAGSAGRAARAWVAALLLMAAGVASAFEPEVGSEVLLADPAGTMMVGYGRMTHGGLQVQLAREAGEVRVIVIAPDGTATTYEGRLADGRLRLRSGDGEEMDVADVLARDERTLTLTWPGEAAAVVPPQDGDAESADGAAGSAAGAGRPGRSDDAPGAGAGQGAADAPGRSGDAPGRSDDAPGRAGDAPGRSGGVPPGQDGDRGGPPLRDLQLEGDDPEHGESRDGTDAEGESVLDSDAGDAVP